MGAWIIGGKAYTNRELNKFKAGVSILLVKEFCRLTKNEVKPTRKRLLDSFKNDELKDVCIFLAEEILPQEFK